MLRMKLLFDTNEDTPISFTTPNGLQITQAKQTLEFDYPVTYLLEKLDTYKGALFSSTYEYPGRYSRWDIGFVNPPLEIIVKQNTFTIHALNDRGIVLINYMINTIDHPAIVFSDVTSETIEGTIKSENFVVTKEEERTKQPSIFELLRQIQAQFYSNDEFLGLYGAFGYDLILQFEKLNLKKNRTKDQSDLHLYLPDEFYIADHEIKQAYKLSYDFNYRDLSTQDLPRTGVEKPYKISPNREEEPYNKGYYASLVNKAKKSFAVGDLFEVVPTQVLSKKCDITPTEVFRNLRRINPSPYGFLIHLDDEYLVGCSPEMFVRVEDRIVETCPISGTIARGASSIEDAEQIKTLLNSTKEESELTMCTDVDRNDKSRVCVPGTVEVIGRRQIETYSHLFHTVDHIKGQLKEGFDAFDAFMTHMWAVTVTGAPKLEAMSWIEEHEATPRGWYGGAIGYFCFNGNLNTGLTLRTVKLNSGLAQIRVGATLLYDSIPESEEQETLTKAQALMEALRPAQVKNDLMDHHPLKKDIKHRRVLLIDHEDSFVHTLSSYIQSLGAEVTVMRSVHARDRLTRMDEPVDLVILSPGPGDPDRFNMKETIQICLEKGLPIFGICLGLQGVVEYFGGELDFLSYPSHGKKSLVKQAGDSKVFEEIPKFFYAGRYHSIYAKNLPDDLTITACTEDDYVMAIEHKTLPIAAVQFHPESIMTMNGNAGLQMLKNVLTKL